jgi:hypothetical protein
MKLAVALLTSLALVTPALACPNMDHDEAPKTAEKKPADKDKAKEQPKADPAKEKQAPADTAKTKDGKGDKKPGDKVSLK